MSKETERIKKKITELEAGNQRSYTELLEKTKGRAKMDTSDMRRELFIDHLVEWGVISEEQKLQFDLAFLKKVEEALNDFWAQWRAAQEAPPKLQVVKKQAKLVDGRGRPLT